MQVEYLGRFFVGVKVSYRGEEGGSQLAPGHGSWMRSIRMWVKVLASSNVESVMARPPAQFSCYTQAMPVLWMSFMRQSP